MVLGEGFHAAAGRAARRARALAACGRSRPGGRDAVRLARAVRPHGPDAAVHRRDRRRRHRARGDRLRRPEREGRRPRPGILRDEGIKVDAGRRGGREARLLDQPFRKHARTGRPFVLLKSAMTLDGKVATGTGDSKWISGEDSRGPSHRWRAESTRSSSGIGTVLADDPLLTARIDGVLAPAAPDRLRRRGPAAAGQPARARRRRGAGDPGLVPRRRARGPSAGGRRRRRRVATGANEPDRVRNALVELGARGSPSMLVEGGPHLAGAFLDAGEVDETACSSRL